MANSSYVSTHVFLHTVTSRLHITTQTMQMHANTTSCCTTLPNSRSVKNNLFPAIFNSSYKSRDTELAGMGETLFFLFRWRSVSSSSVIVWDETKPSGHVPFKPSGHVALQAIRSRGPSRTDQLQVIALKNAFRLHFICDTNNSKPQAELVMMDTTM